MAQGLFCTLIAGTILEQIGKWIGDNAFGAIVLAIAKIAKTAMGFGIGVGIANALGVKNSRCFPAGWRVSSERLPIKSCLTNLPLLSVCRVTR